MYKLRIKKVKCFNIELSEINYFVIDEANFMFFLKKMLLLNILGAVVLVCVVAVCWMLVSEEREREEHSLYGVDEDNTRDYPSFLLFVYLIFYFNFPLFVQSCWISFVFSCIFVSY